MVQRLQAYDFSPPRRASIAKADNECPKGLDLLQWPASLVISTSDDVAMAIRTGYSPARIRISYSKVQSLLRSEPGLIGMERKTFAPDAQITGYGDRFVVLAPG